MLSSLSTKMLCHQSFKLIVKGQGEIALIAYSVFDRFVAMIVVSIEIRCYYTCIVKNSLHFFKKKPPPGQRCYTKREQSYLSQLASIIASRFHLLGRLQIRPPVFQSIAHPRYGEEKARIFWVQFHFLTEVADMGFDQTRISIVPKAPDM